MAKSISSKFSLNLDLPPSCIQFSPTHPTYLVIGTYNLQRDENNAASDAPTADEAMESQTTGTKAQSRDGSLIVYEMKDNVLRHVQTLSTPSALLDLRFSHIPGQKDIMAVISSTGTLAIFRFDPAAEPNAPLQHLATSRCDDLDESVLFLQCQWHPAHSNTMGVTTSAGSARLLQLDEQWRICGWTDLDIANTLEAWCIAFAPSGRELASSGQTTVYCGGDDSILRYTTSAYGLHPRATEDVEVAAQPSILKNQHNAGVTAILPLDAFDTEGSRLVITGSYDDNIRLFAMRDPDPAAFTKRAELLAEETLEGGVWRLDLVHANASAESPIFRVLASCMYAGARLVQFARDKQGVWQCDVLAKFEEHQSMNYGCGVVPGSEGQKSLQCVSTSFYDKMICLWDVELES